MIYLLGLTEPGSEIPKLRGPKRATKILKEFGLLEIYNKKKKDVKERKTLPLMITRLLPKREVKTKNGKNYFKRPKVQRLITPKRLQRKKVIKAIKKERREFVGQQKQAYDDTLKAFKKTKKNDKKQRRKTKVAAPQKK